MNKLAIALVACVMLGIAAPANAQGIVIGVDDGYRSYGYRGWWGGPYAYRSWWGGPRAEVRVFRAHPRFRDRRRFDGYSAYGYRSWWGGY